AHGRQRFLLERGVRRERVARDDRSALDRDDGALVELRLLQFEPAVALDELEGEPRRREEELALAGADPERAAHAAGEEELGPVLVDPRGRHRPVELLKRVRGAAARLLGER